MSVSLRRFIFKVYIQVGCACIIRCDGNQLAVQLAAIAAHNTRTPKIHTQSVLVSSHGECLCHV